MDNGVQGSSKMSARELTREIDRATDMAQGNLAIDRGATAGLGRQAIVSTPEGGRVMSAEEVRRVVPVSVTGQAVISDERQVASSSQQLKLWAAARTEAAKTEVDELAEGASMGWQPGELSTETQQLAGEELEKRVIESNLGIKERVAIENGYKDNGIEVGASVIGGESALQIEERKGEDYEDALVDAGEAVDLRRKNDTLTKQAVKEIRQEIRKKAQTPAALERAWYERTNAFLFENFQRKIGDRN